MNLLYIINSLQIGGAEKQVVTLLRELNKEKYHITLCCFKQGGQLEEELKNEDIELVFLRMRWRYFFVALYKLVSLIKRRNIQIVHTHLYDGSFWGRIAALIAGVPVIIATEHGRGLWKKRRHLVFERIANRFTDMRIAVSEDVRRIRIQRENTLPEKVVMIPNCIRPDDFIVSNYIMEKKRKEFDLKNDELVVGTVARLDHDKGLDYLLESAAFVAGLVKNVRFLLVGDGQLRIHLKNYAVKLGIADKIIFTGARKDIAELLSIMDVYVNSSIREGIPVSLLEAMAAKRAVVATNVGGNPEVINNESIGIIVPPKNSGALAEGIISFLKNKALREITALKARERILKHFCVNMQAKKIDALYEELLRAKLRSRNKEKGAKIPVIMYHSVGPDDIEWIWRHINTPIKIFEKQIENLSKKGFNSISLQDLNDYMKYNRKLSKNSIVLTFDDGYLDNWVYAYPILKKYRMKGTIFVNPDFVDPTEDHRLNLEDVWNGRCREEDLVSKGFLSWREMREMEESGTMDIQSHSMSHTWYFCKDEITDFHSPGNNKYPWLFWNVCPERKSYYLNEKQDRFVPYGTPVYQYGKSLEIRRYFDDENLAQYLVDFVNKKGIDFFQEQDWKTVLFHQVDLYKSKNELKGRYETDKELRERFKYELIESKNILEHKLKKKIDFLCWAGGAYNDVALKIAKEGGYISSTLFFDNESKKNTFGENPSEVNRIDCVSAFYWHNRFISYTDPGHFMAHIRYFQGSKIYLWIMRLYKIKYLIKFTIKRVFGNVKSFMENERKA